MGWTHINNRKNFLLDSVPSYHPASSRYINFWKSEKKKIIEGYWGPDDANIKKYDVHDNTYDIQTSKWRYMPPQLYFYVNYGTILHNDDNAPKTAPKKKMKPLLRDVEWEFFYNWIEARGFSGFSEDEEFTCNREVEKYENNDDSAILDSTCKNKDGKIKKYVSARDYIRKLHDKPLGIPLYMNEAKNLFMLGCLAENTKVRMANGDLKSAKDISVEDAVMGPDGKERHVQNLVRGESMMYRVDQRYGESYECSMTHMLHLKKRKQVKVEDDSGRKTKLIYEPVDIMVQEFVELPEHVQKTYQAVTSEAIEYHEKQLPLDPYFIGLWLGDGFKHRKMICVNQEKDKEILEWLHNYANSNKERFSYTERESKNGLSDGFTTRFSLIDNTMLYKNNWFVKTLRLNKHIPDDYMKSSIKQRLALLAGYIDSDGHYEKERYRITSVDRKLLEQTQELARSLGFRAKIEVPTSSGITDSLKYNLTITGEIYKIPVKLTYKKAAYDVTKIKGSNINNIKITAIEPTKFYGFEVDGDHLFLLHDYTVLHNSRGFG